MRFEIAALSCALACTIGAPRLIAADFFVSTSGNNGNDGSDWNNAWATITYALSQAQEGDRIMVAQGTYVPNTTDRTVSFVLKNDVDMFGGFEGVASGLDPSDRIPWMYDSILSGEVLTAGIDDNTHHVVIAGDDITEATRLSGFVITAGNADGTGTTSPADSPIGGGMLIEGGHPQIDRCVFSQNVAGENQTPNEVAGLGAGLGVLAESSDPPAPGGPALRLGACVFEGNFAHEDGVGAGLYVGQFAGAPGGAGGFGTPLVINTLIADNDAQGPLSAGAGVFVDNNSFAEFRNVTVVDNALDTNDPSQGGAGLSTLSDVRVDSSIFWDNDVEGAMGLLQQVEPIDPLTVEMTYSDTMGGKYPPVGAGNQSLDPLFTADYRLSSNSPLIDLGEPDVRELPTDTIDVDDDGNFAERMPDLDTLPRIVNGNPLDDSCPIVDMGAYEFQSTGPGFTCPADLNGDVYVDVGDLLLVLAEWGCTALCTADADGDGDVDVDDMLVVLAAWGPCCDPADLCCDPDPEGPPQSVFDCLERYGEDPAKAAACIIAVTGG